MSSHALDDPRLSRRVNTFPESVIRDMTRVANEHGAVNLSQGFPDWNPPAEAIAAAKTALDGPNNQYAITWGTPVLREAVAEKVRWFNGIDVDPDREVTVQCGVTEAMMAALLAVVDPGDEVIVFEPYYENYGPDAIISGATLRHVPLRPENNFHPDADDLAAAFSDRTKAIIVNTPGNPSGTVLTRDELRMIGDLATDHDALILTDEIYEHILYDDRKHLSPIMLDGLRDRTVMMSGASKTYSATGWRIAWTIAPPTISTAIRRVHDFLTVGAAHPLQHAAAACLRLPRSYYADLAAGYAERRAFMTRALRDAGFTFNDPEGAYYVMADFTDIRGDLDDVAFANWLAAEVGVAGVPGSSFFADETMGESLIRFHFAKSLDVLGDAATRLENLQTAKVT